MREIGTSKKKHRNNTKIQHIMEICKLRKEILDISSRRVMGYGSGNENDNDCGSGCGCGCGSNALEAKILSVV